MKNTLINKHLLYITVLAFFVSLAACDKWNDTEAINAKDPSIENQNAEVYQKYLESLSRYKQSEHQVVITYFDNTDTAYGRVNHLTSIPDSVDMVVLTNPNGLPQWMKKEMEEVRRKGTKVLYMASYDMIGEAYKKMVNDIITATPPEQEMPEVMPFKKFIDQSMGSFAEDVKDYDGVLIHFEGASDNNMTQEEKEEYHACQRSFIGKIGEWYSSNKGKALIFDGNAHHLNDKSLLGSCKYIVLPTEYSENTYVMTQQAFLVINSGVPSDRFVFRVTTHSLDPSLPNIGYMNNTNGDKVSAILETAHWIVSDNTSFTKAGIAISHVQNDYYNTDPKNVYTHIRQAISIINPAPKN